jgi:glucokinase
MFLLVNIGATKTKIGLSKNFKRIDKIEIFDTYQDYFDFLKFFKDKFSSLKIKSASFGLPGVLNQNKDKLIYAPNLKDFENKNIKRDLEKILKCRILLENDAALEGLGEAYFGKGKRFNIFGYITLGTGVGGVRIVNREIDKKFFGFEPGHTLFLIEEKFFEFENIFSGKAIEKIFNKKPEEIKDKNIWSFYSEVLSAFLINVSLFWSPEAIILNGSLIQSLNKKILLSSFKKLFPFNLKPKITFSNLKEKAGIYGALIYIKKSLKYN